MTVLLARMRGCQSPRRFGLEHAKGLEELFGGHAVFGVAGVIHDAIGELEQATRIKTAADCLGDGPATCSKNSMWLMSSKLTMALQLVGELKVGRRRVVGREHDDVVSRDAQRGEAS